MIADETYEMSASVDEPTVELRGDDGRSPPVLVALSAGGDSFGAIAVAEAIEQRFGGAVHSVYVFGHRRVALPARVPRAWAIHLDVGRAVNGILRCAHRTRAALIALGLRRHGVIDRLMHEETVLGVARRARVPTLAVVPELRGLPHRAVVAVDFGPAGLRTACAARDLVARPMSGQSPSLRLAYASTSSRYPPGPGGVEAAFERLTRALDPPPYLRVDWTVLRGTPARSLLNLAADTDADLVAVGTAAGPELVRPRHLGNVARDVIRAARCSVLVVPVDETFEAAT